MFQPEKLPTLSVSQPVARPGERVTLTFGVVNGATRPTRALRVRFILTPELQPVSARCGGNDIELSSILEASGTALPSIEPGGYLAVDLECDLRGLIEDGTIAQAQVGLLGPAGQIGSNIVRVAIVSTPAIEGAVEVLESSGDVVRVGIRAKNVGTSTAHDVVVRLPIPDGYVLRDGDGTEGGYFTVRHGALRPNAVMEERCQLQSSTHRGVLELEPARVSALEIAGLDLASPPPMSVGQPRVTLKFETDDVVEAAPGETRDLRLLVCNEGTAPTEAAVILEAMGSTSILPAVRMRGAVMPLIHPIRTRLAAGETVQILVTVAVDASATKGAVKAYLENEPTSAVCDVFINAASSIVVPEIGGLEVPRFIDAMKPVPVTVRILNAGSAVADGVSIVLASQALHRWESANDSSIALTEEDKSVRIVLGAIRAGEVRELALRAYGIDECGTDHGFVLTVSLPNGTELARRELELRAHPWIEVEPILPSESLRPGRSVPVRWRLRNAGHAVASEIVLTATGDDRLSIEVDLAERTLGRGGEIVVQGAVTLARYVEGNAPVRVDATLRAVDDRGMEIVRKLDPMWLRTFAEPNVVGELTVDAAEIEAGSSLAFELQLRNEGDGPTPITLGAYNAGLEYLLGTCTLDRSPLHDAIGGLALHREAGLRIPRLEPGQRMIVAWESVVSVDVDDTTLRPSVTVTWDGKVTPVASADVSVRSAPLFPLALRWGDEVLQVPEATPASEALGAAPRVEEEQEDLSQGELDTALAPVPETPAAPAFDDIQPPPFDQPAAAPAPPPVEVRAPQVAESNAIITIVDLSEAKLEQMRNVATTVQGLGLSAHLFALRSLLPDRIAARDEAAATALDQVRAELVKGLDRLFVRLSLSDHQVGPADLESPRGRAALRALVQTMLDVDPATQSRTRDDGSLWGTVGIDRLATIRADLAQGDETTLGGAESFLALAYLMPEHSDSALVSQALSAYKERLLNVLWAYVGQADFARRIGEPAPSGLDQLFAEVIEALETVGVAVA